MLEITRRQIDILEMMVEYFKKNQRMPTFREIGRSFNILSTNGVNSHLVLLQKKGYIRFHHKRHRGTFFTAKTLQMHGISLNKSLLNEIAIRNVGFKIIYNEHTRKFHGGILDVHGVMFDEIEDELLEVFSAKLLIMAKRYFPTRNWQTIPVVEKSTVNGCQF